MSIKAPIPKINDPENRFPNFLDIRYIGDYDNDGDADFYHLSDFLYRSPKYGDILVPETSMTDGNSIPRIAWSLAGSPWSGKNIYSAIVHDPLCQTHGQLINRPDVWLTKKQVDDVFMEIMEYTGLSFYTRKIRHFFVRAHERKFEWEN